MFLTQFHRGMLVVCKVLLHLSLLQTLCSWLMFFGRAGVSFEITRSVYSELCLFKVLHFVYESVPSSIPPTPTQHKHFWSGSDHH